MTIGFSVIGDVENFISGAKNNCALSDGNMEFFCCFIEIHIFL
jgi:hypothetical protein